MYGKGFRNPFQFLLFLSTLILAFLLRAQETISNNYLFLIDQGRDLMAVKGIVFDHHLTLIGPYTSLSGVFQGPLWYYVLAIPIFILQGNPWGTILLMLTISLMAALISFFWMKRLFGFGAAFVTFVLFAVSPEAVAAATYSWNPHPMWLVLVIYIFILFETVGEKIKLHLLLWPLIAVMFHFQTALAVFVLLSTLLLFFLFHRKLLKTKYFVGGLLLSGIFFLPQILFDIRHDFLMSKSLLAIISGKDQGLLVTGESRSYGTLVSTHISSIIYNFETAFLHLDYFKKLPLTVFLLSIFIVFTKRSAFTSREKLFVLTLLQVIIIVSILFTFFYPFPIRYWFLTGFQVLFLLLCGFLLSKLWSQLFGKAILVIFISILVIASIYRIFTLYFTPQSDGGTAKIKGKLDAIDYIYNDTNGQDFGALVFTPPVNTDAYDYLIWWKGKNDYIPHKEKKGTFYLLIEPDPEKPWSYKGWMETVIKTGKIIKTQKLKNGFIVQKRVQK